MKPRHPLFITLVLLLSGAFTGSLLRLYLPQAASIFDKMMAIGVTLFMLVCMFDYLLSRHRLPLNIQRIVPENISLGRDIPIQLQVSCHDPQLRIPIPVMIADCLPPDWRSDTSELTLLLPPRCGVEIGYIAHALCRGDTAFSGIDYAVPSRLGLWWMVHRLPENQTVKVLPDFSRILGADLVGFHHWLNLMGTKKNRRRGTGQEFFQLRDFSDGDDVRHIDWKATARAHKPIVRTFQDERDRRIIFLLDCSRNMAVVNGTFSHFDHALNAMLLLSYTALKHGDAVGAMTFNAAKERFLPPHRDMAQIGRLIDTVYDIEPTFAAADLEHATERLLQQQTRRSLVIILSHLSHDADDEMVAILKRLHCRHLVLFANLRQTVAAGIQAQDLTTPDEALTYLSAQMYHRAESHALNRLNAEKIPHLNVLPSELSAALINHYMHMKRAGAW